MLLEAELPDEKIERAISFFMTLSNSAKVGFVSALVCCDCHICRETNERIKNGRLR